MSYLSSIWIAVSAVLAAFFIALMSGPSMAQESSLLAASYHTNIQGTPSFRLVME